MFYFAYGSNMSWRQMQLRCPSSQFVCVARLPNYGFGITRHSRLRACGTANVFPTQGKEVWGIVYDVSDADLLALDGFEDGYRRQIISVFPRDDGTRPLEALVYLAEIESNVPLSNSEYKKLILEGARHWNLPTLYLVALETIPTAADG